MKAILGILLLVMLGSAVAVGGIFYYRNLRGVGPAIQPPVKNIVEEFADTNATGFPLVLPKGFSISLFADGLVAPRVLAVDPSGRIVVSITKQGKVIALEDADGDGKSDTKITVLSGLNRPHGLAFRGDKLFVAESDKVVQYSYDTRAVTASDKRKVIDLPNGGNHFTRTIGFGPDGNLYVSVGSSCNVCEEKDERRTKILVIRPNETKAQVYAKGLRNSVFFTWNALTGKMWSTEMGRDLIGDDVPPDEINIISEGKFYGWPYCYGKNIHDETYDTSLRSRALCGGAESSYIDIPAHSAPLGLAFIPDSNDWPEQYRQDLMVAYHGSWNRTEPTGYKVVRYLLDDEGNYQGEEDFITGWLGADGVIGRPVDILTDHGAMYISDDKAGVIYRVTPSNVQTVNQK